MPNPKVGTVTPDVAGAVKAAKGGAVEFRVEKAGILHAGVGKASFTEEALLQNIKAFTDAVQKAKPAGAKGTYVKRVVGELDHGPRRARRSRPRSTRTEARVSGRLRPPGYAGSNAGEVLSETAWRACRRLIPRRGLQ